MKLIKSKKYQNVFSYSTDKGTLYAFRYPYYDFLGKRHEKQKRGFKSELEAHKAELKIELLISENESQRVLDSSMTVKQWTERFFKMRESSWSPNSRDNFRTVIKHYINPLIGKRRLGELNKMDYKYYFIQKQEDMGRLKETTIRANHQCFMVILNAAVESNIIPRNPLGGIRFAIKQTRKPFSMTDLNLFNSQLKLEPLELRVFFLTLELTGMRLGEGLGLEWKDVGFETNTINIRRSRGAHGIGPTKTPSSVRKVAVDPMLIALLYRLFILQKKESLQDGKSLSDDSLIYPKSPRNIDYHYHKILEQAGIETKGEKHKYVIHSLRHTHATILIGSGVSPVDVAKRLGHTNPATTLKIYAHALSENDDKSVTVFSKMVGIQKTVGHSVGHGVCDMS